MEEKLPIKEACMAMEKYLGQYDIDNQYDIFSKGDAAGVRIRLRLERYEDGTAEDLPKYISKFRSFHGWDVIILHVPNGYIDAFPSDRHKG